MDVLKYLSGFPCIISSDYLWSIFVPSSVILVCKQCEPQKSTVTLYPKPSSGLQHLGYRLLAVIEEMHFLNNRQKTIAKVLTDAYQLNIYGRIIFVDDSI